MTPVPGTQRCPDCHKWFCQCEPSHEFELIVSVTLHGEGTCEDAAKALRDHTGTFDLPGGREVEIIAVRPS